MEIIRYLEVSAISFGLAFSFATTSGPLGLFKRVREQLEKSKYEWFSEGVNCPICLSCWISAIVSYSMGCGVEGWLFSFGMTCVINSLSPE